MSQSQSKNDNIYVIARIKPEEDKNNKLSQMKITDSTITMISSNNSKHEYSLDYIAKEESTQEEIFVHCGKEICDHALKGYNCTIFAYGQTGSGKTYTLLGKK